MTANAETPRALSGGSQEAIFAAGESATPTVPQPPARRAGTRVVATERTDALDPERRRVVLLVVDCPFCGRYHIHAGGHVDQVLLGERQARCAGTHTDGMRYELQAVYA